MGYRHNRSAFLATFDGRHGQDGVWQMDAMVRFKRAIHRTRDRKVIDEPGSRF